MTTTITPSRVRQELYKAEEGISRYGDTDIQAWIDSAAKMALLWEPSLDQDTFDEIVLNLSLWKAKRSSPDLYAFADPDYKAAKDLLMMFQNRNTADLMTEDDSVDSSAFVRSVGELPNRMVRDRPESTKYGDDRDPLW